MDRLWSPWRYAYVSQAEPSPPCIFCDKAAEQRDLENYVLFRGQRNFALLNIYPYNTGHLMVAPYDHVASLVDLDEETLAELARLVRDAERHLRAVYRPAGLNIGINLGECAGAGVAGHVHVHVLPRWPGDTSFMTTVGEARVLPEALTITYEKLAREFQRS